MSNWDYMIYKKTYILVKSCRFNKKPRVYIKSLLYWSIWKHICWWSLLGKLFPYPFIPFVLKCMFITQIFSKNQSLVFLLIYLFAHVSNAHLMPENRSTAATRATVSFWNTRDKSMVMLFWNRECKNDWYLSF